MQDVLSNNSHVGFQTLSTKPGFQSVLFGILWGQARFRIGTTQDLVPSLPWALGQVKDLSCIQQTGLDLFHLRGLLQ